MHRPSAKQVGFTIVELLIVIVVIGILVVITIVTFNGIQRRARDTSLVADLTNASRQLKLFQVVNGTYPVANDCSASPAAGTVCLKSSLDNSYGSSYVPNNAVNPPTFTLQASNGGTTFAVTESSNPIAVVIPELNCPTGFIVVPGSATYGTSDFCVMKYEAKNVSNVATSQAAGLPWGGINLANAISYASSSAGCTGCHLITEAEWMTIAKNVLSVSTNWSGGAMGNGYIYSGHNDGNPASSLAANSSDASGYSGTSNVSPSNQRRTLTLTNGEVIWDFSGNLWEWTSSTVTTGEPGINGESSIDWKEWPAVNNNGSNPINPSPAGTGLAGASSWNSTKGIGQLYSFVGETALRGYLRGGNWGYGAYVGVLALTLGSATNDMGAGLGFRAAR